MTRAGRATVAALLVASACSGARGGGSTHVSVVTTVDAPVGAALGVAVDAGGQLLVADPAANRVRAGTNVLAGTGEPGFSGDGGAATSARLNAPAGVAVGPHGDVYVADQGNNRIRRIDGKGRITTIAGTAETGSTGDGGPAALAILRAPAAVAVGHDGSVYFTGPAAVRRIGPDGRISTVVGGGTRRLTREGGPTPATGLDLGAPGGISVGWDGTLYVAVPTDDWVLAVAPDGVATIRAGNRDNEGAEDYDGPASAAVLHGPTGLATDRHGNLFVTEPDARRIRRVDSQGTIHTVLPASRAGIESPAAVAVAPNGDLLVVDAASHQVNRVTGTAGRIVGPPRPAIDELRPSAGGAGGETAVVIRGHGFTAAGTTVRFGRQSARVVNVSPTDLLVSTPPQPPGTVVDVLVTTRSGTSEHSVASRFSYETGWERTGPLATARLQHTATLLPDGGVLVAGGNEAFCITCQPYASAERYDPSSGSWQPTGAMGAARMEHTATLLGTGMVLVAGGKATIPSGLTAEERLFTSNALASTELYDPATGGWRPAGAMTDGRFSHTASVLADGRILVAGGAYLEYGRRPRGSAELYDPATGRWSETGRLNQARGSHTATVLPDGRVLVAGGLGGEEFPSAQDNFPIPDPVATAEIYDPGTGSWTRTADMAVARYGHTATMLPNGKVLVVGGFGSGGPGVFLQSAEVYDPVTGRWSPAAVPRAGRAGHIALLLARGVVLVAGGGPIFEDPRSRPEAVAAAELYDPESNTWSPTRIMNTGRGAAAAVLLRSGAAMVVGGGGTNDNPEPRDSPFPLASAEIYR